MSLKQHLMRSFQQRRQRQREPDNALHVDTPLDIALLSEKAQTSTTSTECNKTGAGPIGFQEKSTDTEAFSGTLFQDAEVLPMSEPTPLADVSLPFDRQLSQSETDEASPAERRPTLTVVASSLSEEKEAAADRAINGDASVNKDVESGEPSTVSELDDLATEASNAVVCNESTQEESLMSDLSGYKDLSKAPFLGEDDDQESTQGQGVATLEPPAKPQSTFSNVGHASLGSASAGSAKVPQLSLDNLGESKPAIETEISGNVQTLIRLVSELPEGVTKQNGAQIIRLTMEAMGIPMEDVLAEAQSSQTELLDAVRGNLKKIEEYKAVIRKLETDIKYYQGKANELSEIIDLFIMSGGAAAEYNQNG